MNATGAAALLGPFLCAASGGFFWCGTASWKEGMEGRVYSLVPCPAVTGAQMGHRACGQREGLTMVLLSAHDAMPA